MYNVSDCCLIELPKIINDSGSITVLENKTSILFDIKRIYYLYDVPSSTERGGHAHFELEQYIVAVTGSFTFVLDDGKSKMSFFLNRPNLALHIKPGIWREIVDFSGGSICLVLASHEYNEKDYIRQYEDFIEYKKL